MRALTASLFVLVAVAACSPAADKKAAAPVAAAPASDSVMRPGRWRTTMTFAAMTIPGLPPAAVAKMKAHPFTTEECVNAKDMDDYLGKRANTEPNAKCTVNRMSRSGGRIEGESVCADGDGKSHTVHTTGTYSADHVDMVVNIEGVEADGAMTQSMSLKADRIGDCAG